MKDICPNLISKHLVLPLFQEAATSLETRVFLWLLENHSMLTLIILYIKLFPEKVDAELPYQ